MTSHSIEYVGHRVIEDCNAGSACRQRCFSVENGTILSDPPLQEIYEVHSRLRDAGLPAINIMGGEPTMRKDLPEILAFAHTLGFETVLSTNTMLLTPTLLDALAPHLNWLSVSLDADTSRKNNALRGRGQFEAVKSTLEHIATRGDYPFRLKVNTQVTAKNLADLEKIPELFHDSVVVWKLLQWTPRADARLVRSVYEITAEQYDLAVQQLRKEYPNITIVERPYPEPDPDTVIVRPGGELEVNAGMTDYQVVGNILTEPASDVLTRASVIYSRLSEENQQEHSRSYPR